MKEPLDPLHHVAIPVKDVGTAVEWYLEQFHCQVSYQDATWALLRFDNIQLALVIPEQHPPHLAVTRKDAERFGSLVPHRDGTRSCYVMDPAGNAVEIMDASSL